MLHQIVGQNAKSAFWTLQKGDIKYLKAISIVLWIF